MTRWGRDLKVGDMILFLRAPRLITRMTEGSVLIPGSRTAWSGDHWCVTLDPNQLWEVAA